LSVCTYNIPREVVLKKITYFGLALLLLLVCLCSDCLAQIREERQEEGLKKKSKVEKTIPDYKLTSRIGASVGYDNNVNLDGARKGDMFEEFLYTLRFKKPLGEGFRFNFRYVLDYLNYNEFVDVTNLLNRFVFELDKKISFLNTGVGYDTSYIYYPNYQAGDFFFHKGFFFVGADLTKRLYHQIKATYGLKDYLNAKTLGDTSGSRLDDKERLDRRRAIEYYIKYYISKKLTLRFRASYSTNDSNARYIDYYDYKAHRFSAGLDYKINPDTYLFLDYSNRIKEYKSRTVTSGSYEQSDILHTANAGVIYFLNRDNSLSLNYTYRENSSNDRLSEYAESVIACGWQHYF
jgi:hypothetical protein